MRILIAILLTACSAFCQQASVNVQGTERNSFTTLWTANQGYVTIQRQRGLVDSILITNERGEILLDTYFPKVYAPVNDR